MRLRNICFVVIPLIFFGCGAYFHITKPKEDSSFAKFPENREEMQKQLEQFHGRQR